MLYNFTQDLSNIKSNYESFAEQLKKENVYSDAPVAAGYADTTESLKYSDDGNQGDPVAMPNKSRGISLPSSNISADLKNQNIKIKDGKPGVKTKSSTPKGEGLTTGTAIDSASFLMDVGSSFAQTSDSESESWNQIGSQTIQGAALGAQIGGPWGAAIGGAIGLGAGVVDMIGDSSKRSESERNANQQKTDELRTKREIQYSMDNQQKDLDKLTALRKNQLNYLDLKY